MQALFDSCRSILAREMIMKINLPNDMNEFVNNLVVNGRFESEEAVIAEGLSRNDPITARTNDE
jgi:Arc/MetJ-type ribon-helix-helix transcriptional regulator